MNLGNGSQSGVSFYMTDKDKVTLTKADLNFGYTFNIEEVKENKIWTVEKFTPEDPCCLESSQVLSLAAK